MADAVSHQAKIALKEGQFSHKDDEFRVLFFVVLVNIE